MHPSLWQYGTNILPCWLSAYFRKTHLLLSAFSPPDCLLTHSFCYLITLANTISVSPADVCSSELRFLQLNDSHPYNFLLLSLGGAQFPSWTLLLPVRHHQFSHQVWDWWFEIPVSILWSKEDGYLGGKLVIWGFFKMLHSTKESMHDRHSVWCLI